MTTPTITPMMKQYFEIKAKCPDAILFFRMGDFYEIFGEDALDVAPKLDIVLTSREKGSGEKMPFCGVPYHAAKAYQDKLLKLGYKVAVAEQLEDPQAGKGIVKRGITKVLTPGTVNDIEGLQSDAPNYILAVAEDPTQKDHWGIATADISTGELRAGLASSKQELFKFILQYSPSEILTRQFFLESFKKSLLDYPLDSSPIFSKLPETPLRDEKESKTILSRLNLLDKSTTAKTTIQYQVAAGLLAYMESLHHKVAMFSTIRPLQDQDTVSLNDNTCRALEIFETARRRDLKDSLFSTVNFTQTPLGARLLRTNLRNPLLRKDLILQRRAVVNDFVKAGQTWLQKLRIELKSISDITRASTRIIDFCATPQELALIRNSLRAVLKTVKLFDEIKCGKDSHWLLDELKSLPKKIQPLLKLLETALIETPSAVGAGNQVFAVGYNNELDRLNHDAHNGLDRVQKYEAQLRASTGISSLKVKNHQTFGLLIEITNSNLSKIPAEFTRRQTMVNCERFVTEELKKLNTEICSAQEKSVTKEAELYQNILSDLADYYHLLLDTSSNVSMLDMLQSFTYSALANSYVEPTLTNDVRLSLKASRHPVIEKKVGKNTFTPNDLELLEHNRLILLTGPNMGGKSTLMRQIAIAGILNQIGSYVPAREATMPIFDNIFCRIGASDDLSSGHSTFMIEMLETSEILQLATARSLVLIDEIGRGTSTIDGVAIAKSILVDLCQRVRSYTLFSTHYRELVGFSLSLGGVQLGQMQVHKDGTHIIFTHRLIAGAAESSFGIEVARIAGLPIQVIQQAAEFLTDTVDDGKFKTHESLVKPSANDTGHLRDIIEKLKRVNINRTTPLQALTLLQLLQENLEPKPSTPTLFPQH